jgi:hypothetical protein
MNAHDEAVIEYIKSDQPNAYTIIPWSNVTVGEYANQLIAFHILRKKNLFMVPNMKPKLRSTRQRHKNKEVIKKRTPS